MLKFLLKLLVLTNKLFQQDLCIPTRLRLFSSLKRNSCAALISNVQKMPFVSSMMTKKNFLSQMCTKLLVAHPELKDKEKAGFMLLATPKKLKTAGTLYNHGLDFEPTMVESFSASSLMLCQRLISLLLLTSIELMKTKTGNLTPLSSKRDTLALIKSCKKHLNISETQRSKN